MLSAIGWEKFHSAPGIFQFRAHGGDDFFFVLVEGRPPLFFLLQVDEVFGVEKSRRIGSVIRPANLAGALRHLRKRA